MIRLKVNCDKRMIFLMLEKAFESINIYTKTPEYFPRLRKQRRHGYFKHVNILYTRKNVSYCDAEFGSDGLGKK